MNRRSYVNRERMYRGFEYPCHWCGRTDIDVLETSPASGPMGARYECVNTRRCMKERGVKAAAARMVRELEQARTAEITAAGANTCITASCLVHRQRVFWQSSERRWVHLNCFPCERDIFTAAPAPARYAAAAAAAPRADGALFGVEEIVGAGELAGQRSLFAGVQTR